MIMTISNKYPYTFNPRESLAASIDDIIELTAPLWGFTIAKNREAVQPSRIAVVLSYFSFAFSYLMMARFESLCFLQCEHHPHFLSYLN